LISDPKKLSKRKIIIRDVKNGILMITWLNDILKKDGQIKVYRGTSFTHEGSSWITFNESTQYSIKVTFDKESASDNEFLAEELRKVSKQVINNLRIKGDLIRRAKEEVNSMQQSASKLEAILNPLVLRPIILNTQCDICPI